MARKPIVENTFIAKLNQFLTDNEKKSVLISLLLASIASILLFDVKVSLSGDDCDYLVAAGAFWKHFTYPGHHGPLYPILLSPMVGIFGIQLVALKLFSAILIVASLWFFYKSFQRFVPPVVTLPALLLVSMNPYVMFFSSYTYSEPLFLFMQSLFFYFFSKYFWQRDPGYTLRKDWKKYLCIVLVIIGMGLTRTIGFCTIGIMALYFMLERRWKDLISTVCIFALLFGVLYISKPIIWPNSGTVQSFETLLAKNPYNPEQGAEDLVGLTKRVVKNSHVYLSSFLYKYLGFRSSSDIPLKDVPPLTVLTYLLFFVSTVSVFKKNKQLLFAGMYAGVMIFANFMLLHTVWVQDRILMVYYPYILLFFFGGLYYLFERQRLKKISFVYLLLFVSVLTGTGIHAKNRIGRNIPVLQQNMSGNDLYGLTPDWENFIKMSRWANENLDKEAVIVSRKPSISYVYTGRDFMGIFNVPYVNVHDIAKENLTNRDDHVFLTVELADNQQHRLLNNLAPYMQYLYVSKKSGIFSINDKNIVSAIVYVINKNLFSQDITDFLDANNFNYTLDYDSFIKQYVDDTDINYQIVDPDTLLAFIKDNRIKYLILAKIRLYTSQNTGRFVNTIHQYISFIQYKYPNRFVMVHSIGKDETCELVEFVGD